MHYESWLLMLKLYWNYWLFLVAVYQSFSIKLISDIFYALNVCITIGSVAKKWHRYITIANFCTLVII